jgi:hypothetical protein
LSTSDATDASAAVSIDPAGLIDTAAVTVPVGLIDAAGVTVEERPFRAAFISQSDWASAPAFRFLSSSPRFILNAIAEDM